MSRFIGRRACTECHTPFKIHSSMRTVFYWNDLTDSHGVCPNCGHTSKGTVCDHYTQVWKSVSLDRPWWKFWGADYEYVRCDNDQSDS